MRAQLSDLVALMSLWAKRSTEVQRAVQDVSALAGLEPRKLAPRSDLAPSAEALPRLLAMTIATSSQGPQETRIDTGQSCPVLSPKDGMSPSFSDSDSFDLDMDEEWTEKLHDIEQEGADSGCAVTRESLARLPEPLFAFLGRAAPHVLVRIDEGEHEDHLSSSSSSSRIEEASDSSGASSAERAWANVPEVGYGSAYTCPETAVAVAAAAAAEPAVLPPPPGRRSADREQRRQKQRASQVQAEARYREDQPVDTGLTDVLASWRARRRRSGPKEEGPLSRMEARVGASSTE